MAGPGTGLESGRRSWWWCWLKLLEHLWGFVLDLAWLELESVLGLDLTTLGRPKD